MNLQYSCALKYVMYLYIKLSLQTPEAQTFLTAANVFILHHLLVTHSSKIADFTIQIKICKH